MIWVYRRVPGKNDFLDATAQGYAAAAYNGIGTGGYVEPRKASALFVTSGKRR